MVYDYFFDCFDTDQSCYECRDELRYLDPKEAFPSDVCGECFNKCGDTYRP